MDAVSNSSNSSEDDISIKIPVNSVDDQSCINRLSSKNAFRLSDMIPPVSPDPTITSNTMYNKDSQNNTPKPTYRSMSEEQIYHLSLNMLSYIDTRCTIHTEAAELFAKKQCIFLVRKLAVKWCRIIGSS